MKRGFTLIELLVVIAIIGILASIVLVSFPGATKKAKDSRIVSAVAQARTVMTYINANEGNYADLDDACATTSDYFEDMGALCTEVTANDSDLILISGANANKSGCIYAKLNAKDNYWYCADSRGLAGFVTGTGTDAPNNAANCGVPGSAPSTTTCPAFD